MYSTLMVYLELFRDNSRILNITGDLAERFNASVIGVAASQPIQAIYGSGELHGQTIELDRTQVKDSIESTATSFRAALAPRTRHVEWRALVSTARPIEYVAGQTRSADLVITCAEPGGSVLDSSRCVNTSDLVMQAGRPVLVVPGRADTLAAQTILVGWKDTRETRRVVAEALPFLKTATRVIVAELALEEDLPDAKIGVLDVTHWLKRHGVPAEGIAEKSSGRNSDQLNRIAERVGADLMVMGAYGHSRFREWALGGVTRDFLVRAPLCTLMSH